MNIGMLGITAALTIAGVMQIIYQRIGIAPSSFMEAQEQIIPVYGVRLFFGVLTVIGLLLYLYSFFVKTKAEKV